MKNFRYPCSQLSSDGDNKVKVATTFDAKNENPVKMQREDWQTILNNFKKYAEAS